MQCMNKKELPYVLFLLLQQKIDDSMYIYIYIYINILKCYLYYTDTGSKTNEIYSYHGDKDKQKCEKN